MNKNILDLSLKTLIDNQTAPETKIFVQLLKQVWQIDWNVAAYDIWGHFIEYDVPYFLRFMRADGDQDAQEEKQLLIDWIGNRSQLAKVDSSTLIGLIEELNSIRREALKA